MEPVPISELATVHARLRDRGFAEVCAAADSLALVGQALGRPQPSRENGPVVDRLRPTLPTEARPRSLSARHGLGALPYHTDTAHWPTPARYALLSLASASAPSPTLLLPWQPVVTDLGESELSTEPFVVRNSSRSFLTTLRCSSGAWHRYDAACMKPCTSGGRRLADSIERRLLAAEPHVHHWVHGVVLVIDNWNMLHARPTANPSRQLLRLLVVQ